MKTWQKKGVCKHRYTSPMETIPLGYDTFPSGKGISTSLVTCMLKNRGINIKIKFKTFEFLKMGNYSTVKPTPGFWTLTKNLLWDNQGTRAGKSKWNLWLAFFFRCCSLKTVTKLKTNSSAPCYSLTYSNYPATPVQNEKLMYFFNPRSSSMDLSHRKHFST